MTLEEVIHEKDLTDGERLDILSSLASLISQGVYENLTPTNIIVKQNYDVEIDCQTYREDAYFMAPEQIFNGVEPCEETAWFSFGMLYYYVLQKKIWYIAEDVKIHEILRSNCVIISKNSKWSGINNLISKNLQDRVKGADAFFQLVDACPKGYIKIKYVYEDSVIKSKEILPTKRKIENYAKGEKIKDERGNIYIVDSGVNIVAKYNEQIVQIPLSLLRSATDNIREICIQLNEDESESFTLFEIDEGPYERNIPVFLGGIKKISFWIIEKNMNGMEKNKLKLGDYAMPRKRIEATLFARLDNTELIVSLYNADKSKKLIKADIKITI